jgi:hypothetical protein
MRARCAPPYFDALACFLKRCCVESEDQRVGCGDLHTAFTAFLAETCKDAEPPSQRDLRAVLAIQTCIGFYPRRFYFCKSRVYTCAMHASAVSATW